MVWGDGTFNFACGDQCELTKAKIWNIGFEEGSYNFKIAIAGPHINLADFSGEDNPECMGGILWIDSFTESEALVPGTYFYQDTGAPFTFGDFFLV